MRKLNLFKKVIICFLFLLCFTLASCGEDEQENVEDKTQNIDQEQTPEKNPNDEQPIKLATPVLTVDTDGLASWEAIENASSYVYILNDGTELVTITLSLQLDEGDKLKVKAAGDNINYTDSDYSNEVTYTVVVDEPTPDTGDDDDNNSYTPQECGLCSGNGMHAEPQTYAELPAHTPTTFDASSVTKSTIQITEGVWQHTYQFKKYYSNSSYNASVVVTEVDLNYAKIAAGTKDDKTSASTKTTPYSMATAFEKNHTNATVIAAVNGDFFGSLPVNAFVKDGEIVKDSHNAPGQGTYDYTNIYNDIPASMPMLFGVSGTAAQVNPIIKNGTVQETIDSKLFYELTYTHNGKSYTLASQYEKNLTTGSKTKVIVCYRANKEYVALAGATVLKVKTHPKVGDNVHGEVMEIISVSKRSTFTTTSEYHYVILPPSMEVPNISLGDIISHQVASADGTWNYYDQIIGCRQALVIEGEIPSTVKKENSNAAQTTNVPRTAIGVMPNGHVVIISIECLNYGTSNRNYGLNLPQLADFMRYIGVYSAGNLDGGGSTQLITRLSPSEDFTVIVRSSDTDSYAPKETRTVINGILVYVENEE